MSIHNVNFNKRLKNKQTNNTKQKHGSKLIEHAAMTKFNLKGKYWKQNNWLNEISMPILETCNTVNWFLLLK